MAVLTAIADVGPQAEIAEHVVPAIEIELVVGTNLEVVGVSLAVGSSVSVAAREEVLAGRVLLTVVLGVAGAHVAARTPMPVFLANVIVEARIIDGSDASSLTQRTPVAVLTGLAVIAHVVGIGKER